MRILNTIGEKFGGKAREILGRCGQVDYKIMTQEELSASIGNYDAIFVGLGLNIDRDVLEKAHRLKLIVTATTGLDHIDCDYAKRNKINVLSLRGENDFLDTITGTAELAFGLMISLLRKIPWAFDSVKSHRWDREIFRGNNLYGKTLGIFGLGRLGKMMAGYGKSFGMKIIFTDPAVSQEKSMSYKKVSFKKLLSDSDILSIHAHLNDDTEDIFNKKAFSVMKTGSFLINTSRGKIVNENDLIRALTDGKLAGYATDVLSEELDFHEKRAQGTLIEYSRRNDNVIIVPHIGGMTVESREMTDIFMAEKTLRWIKKGPK